MHSGLALRTDAGRKQACFRFAKSWESEEGEEGEGQREGDSSTSDWAVRERSLRRGHVSRTERW